jgi:hypothetical protein
MSERLRQESSSSTTGIEGLADSIVHLLSGGEQPPGGAGSHGQSRGPFGPTYTALDSKCSFTLRPGWLAVK